jgi:hypothetical protein
MEGSLSALVPLAVPMRVAMFLLGGKCRSEIYAAVGDGLLDARKDGGKTLITTASIISYMTRLPRARLKPIVKRQRRGKLKENER